MTILLKDADSDWYYVAAGTWTPNRRLAQEFQSEEEACREIKTHTLPASEMIYEIKGGMSFSVPFRRN